MFHALNRIGIIKRTTEHLSRQRAARTIVPSQSHQLQKTSEVPSPRLVLEDEDYLLVDIKDDGTAEASRVDPGCRVGLVLVVSHSQKALDLKGAADIVLVQPQKRDGLNGENEESRTGGTT